MSEPAISSDRGAVPATFRTARRAMAVLAMLLLSLAPLPVEAQGSRVLGKRDIVLRDMPACEIRFAYAGMDAETLFWEEPCADVTVRMMGEEDLRALGRWSRLDEFDQRFVRALPGGRVLYVEGRFSASVYPVGTTGATYERPVAD